MSVHRLAGGEPVAETLLTYNQAGDLVGTFLGTPSPEAAAAAMRASHRTLVVNGALRQVGHVLHSQLALSGATAAIMVSPEGVWGFQGAACAAVWPVRSFSYSRHGRAEPAGSRLEQGPAWEVEEWLAGLVTPRGAV
jgi:hypothetical protein